MSIRSSLSMCLAVSAVALLAAPGSARADLALTAAGIAEGFTLSIFASGFPDTGGGGGVGPISVGFLPGGGTVVTSYANNTTVTFPTDTDGQTVSANGTVNTGFFSPAGATTLGGVVYVANQGTGTVVSLNNDGSLNATVASGIGFATGLVSNPNNGHLLVSDVSGTIFDVNPSTGVKTPLVSGFAVDGMSVSPDGTTLFFESGGHIYGFVFATSAITDYTPASPIPGADGAAVAAGTLAGNIFVNTNFGQVVEIDEATFAQTVIATGGSRGDLVSVDPNGTLLLSQSNDVVRLTLPAGSTFTNTPEPASLGLFAAASTMLGALRRRRRSR